MSQEILNIILAAIGTIITGLATWGVAAFTSWINSKMKDQKVANFLSSIMQIVCTSVQEIYQCYVESLKADGKFDKAAQEKALNMCLTKIKSQLAPDLVEFIKENYGDVEKYLIGMIESTIYSLKK